MSPSRLEPVAIGVPVSPNSLDLEGFGETDRIPRRGCSGGSLLASPVVVCPSSPTSSLPCSSSLTSTVASGQLFEGLRSHLCNREVTRLAFLRYAYERLYSGEVLDFLLSALRSSSYRQYESVWRSFQSFCIRQSPLVINLDLVLRFLVFVFQDKGYQVSTIASMKSSLVEPLRIAFDLDLNNRCVC